MAAALRVSDLGLRYPRADAPTLRGIAFELAVGERMLVTGPSGAGKSSLALCWNGIIPQSLPASLTGAVELCGRPVADSRVAALAATIAYVFQDADSQLCALSVEDEIAFALENRCLAPAEIDRRIDAAMTAVGLPAAMRRRETLTLSGGEKQKVTLAAALAQDAPVYVFDEPTSQLDPQATERAYAVIDRLAQAGRSLICIDHKIERLLDRIDRVLLLDGDGRVAACEPPDSLFHDHAALVARTGAWMPAAASLFAHLRACGIAIAARPLALDAALAALDRHAAQSPSARVPIRNAVEAWLADAAGGEPVAAGRPVLRLDGVGYAPARGIELLRDVDLDLHGGEIVGLVGRNGAGKSTLAQIIAGLVRPTRGARIDLVTPHGEPGQFQFQNPEHQFTGESVLEEMAQILGPDAAATIGAQALKDFGLWDKRLSHPFALSQGQKRRLSFLVAALAPARAVLVLDEPSYGLDARAALTMRRAIAAERRSGRAIVVVSHDIDWLAGLCDRIAVLDAGRLVAIAPAARVLADDALLARHGLAPPLSRQVTRWLSAHG